MSLLRNKSKDYIKAHTVGFEQLKETVAQWQPDRVESVSGVPAQSLRAVARILGSTQTLVSTALQGVYQSMQATAAAIQVNNLHLIRGLLGKPGCGILQMNGQPTAQNTRETGCDGALPAFRNWANPEHMEELARIWNVNPDIIPHWSPPTHAMQIFRYAETGSIKMLWIIATNPAVSLPELSRIREILNKNGLFVVVQDAFMTETAEFVDIILPAAIWGEKTGCFTNTDRTVHISHKAIDPPGEARSDLDIFLDYAKGMDLRDKDGASLIKWDDPEGAFEAWKECTRGRFCDYTGISYGKLSKGSGIQWPCNMNAPDGTERLYTDRIFNTDANKCETFGHDLITGAVVSKKAYQANNPAGRAILKAANYMPPHEEPDEEYPLWLTTGRIVYHWHTRTKTARAKELNDAAPDAFVQISGEDAAKYGISEEDWVEVESRHGKAQARATIGDIIQGHVFIPFHYGYWDNPERPRAANELTLTEWDPVSKQPHFKYAAVRIRKIERSGIEGSGVEESRRGTTEKMVEQVKKATEEVKEKIIPSKLSGRHIGDYIGMVHSGEIQLAEALSDVAEHHRQEPDIYSECKLLSSWSKKHMDELKPFIERYSEKREKKPEELRKALFHGPRSGSLGLLRDLHDLWLLANENHISYVVLSQAARGLRDKQLLSTCEKLSAQTERQISWLLTRIKQAAPQTLVVPM